MNWCDIIQYQKYYRMFKDEKWSPLATKLSWSHYSELLSIKDSNKLSYYINTAHNNSLSKRELREKLINYINLLIVNDVTL